MSEALRDETIPVDEDNAQDYYNAICREIGAEYNLANARMGWNLTFNGFLFTAYTFLQNAPETVQLRSILPLIPIFALIIEVFFFIGIHAALRRVEYLKLFWLDDGHLHMRNYGPRPFSDTEGSRCGKLPLYGSLGVISLAWLTILVYS